jgi:hypothetical protein
MENLQKGWERDRETFTIKGLYETKDYKVFTSDGIVANLVLVDGETIYQFTSISPKVMEAGLT